MDDGNLLRQVVECIEDGAAFIHDEAETRRVITLIRWLAENRELMALDVRHHVIDIPADGEGYTIQHPLACRPNLFSCAVNVAAKRGYFEWPEEPGQYPCWLDMGDLVLGLKGEVLND